MSLRDVLWTKLACTLFSVRAAVRTVLSLLKPNVRSEMGLDQSLTRCISCIVNL